MSKDCQRWLRGSECLQMLVDNGLSGQILTDARNRRTIPFQVNNGNHFYDPEAFSNLLTINQQKVRI